MNSPARTSYASAVAASIRKSRRASPSGAGSSSCSYERGVARRISTRSSEGGGAPSTIRPPGAATTTVTARSARNACDAPGGDHSPKRWIAFASPGSSPRAASSSTSRLPSRTARASRTTVAGASAVAPSAAASSRPDSSRTVTSATCPPSLSTTVTRSSGPSARTVAPPGRTRYVSRNGSSGLRPWTRAGVPGIVTSRLCGRLRLLLRGLRDQLLGQLPLPVGVELLRLVLDGAAVVRLVPVVERVEPEEDGLADELPQNLVRRAHHPARLRVAEVALELHVPLVAGAAAGVEHLVHDVRDVLRRHELDLPRPVQEVGARNLADVEDAGVVVRLAVHRLRDRMDEDARRVRVHDRLADVVLDRRVVGDAEPDVDVALAGRVALRDVDRAHGDAVPDRGRPDEEPRVDGLVVRRGAVADRPDDLVTGDLDVRYLERPGLVAAQAERVPEGRLR